VKPIAKPAFQWRENPLGAVHSKLFQPSKMKFFNPSRIIEKHDGAEIYECKQITWDD
jgi:hypothetical protein